MTLDDALRAIAGIMVILSLALGTWVHPGFYFLTLFVGLNLLQSAFTKWCPMMPLLKKAGLE